MTISTASHSPFLASTSTHFTLQGLERTAPLDKRMVDPIIGYLSRLTQAYGQAVSGLPDLAERAAQEPAFWRASCWEYLLLVWPLCQPGLLNLGLPPRLGQAVDYLLHWNLLTQQTRPGLAGPHTDLAGLIEQRRVLAQGVIKASSSQQQADYLLQYYPQLLLEAPLGYRSRARSDELEKPRAGIRRTLQHRWISDYLLMTTGALLRDQRFEQFLQGIR